ncbi:Hypothetical predicted protein [Pelobates cultripes]|uniref:Uncharacterized protein n=1 Tax=Pelobates cultripes TaxID=61616 RepID=A0AAD1RXW1_PELCU|nr:Hypothetical predicted protein [Pelobates cultripes]
MILQDTAQHLKAIFSRFWAQLRDRMRAAQITQKPARMAEPDYGLSTLDQYLTLNYSGGQNCGLKCEKEFEDIVKVMCS